MHYIVSGWGVNGNGLFVFLIIQWGPELHDRNGNISRFFSKFSQLKHWLAQHPVLPVEYVEASLPRVVVSGSSKDLEKGTTFPIV